MAVARLGSPGATEPDYYVTGTYDPATPSGAEAGMKVDATLKQELMGRSTAVALDGGAFYASKTFAFPNGSRVLWGWLPEERALGPGGADSPLWGWAGALSFPRDVVPYREVATPPSPTWRIRTPPREAALQVLRVASSKHRYDTPIRVGADANGTSTHLLTNTKGRSLS